MNKIILTFLLVAGFNSAFGQLQVQSGEIAFYIKNAGFNVDGKFTQIQATVRFNPDKPKETVIDASVNVVSINTGNRMRDKHLKKDDYFDVTKYPTITLTLKTIVENSSLRFNGLFNLTMKGISKEVHISITFDGANKLMGCIRSFLWPLSLKQTIYTYTQPFLSVSFASFKCGSWMV
jgi:polyisoprenoid-binding protein YceI